MSQATTLRVSTKLPARADFIVPQGTTWKKVITWQNSLGVNKTVNEYRFQMGVRESFNDTSALLFLDSAAGSIAKDTVNNEFSLIIQPSDTTSLDFDIGVFTLKATHVTTGVVTRLIEGNFILTRDGAYDVDDALVSFGIGYHQYAVDVTQYQATSFDQSTGKLILANASAESTSSFAGICTETVSADDYGYIREIGRISNLSWDFTGYIGYPVYLTAVDGEISINPPAPPGISQAIGYVTAATEILVIRRQSAGF